MKPWKNPKVKICCIGGLDEAKMAIEAGADAIGLVGPMPSGPGIINNKLIQMIAKAIPPPIGTFLLSSETVVREIIKQHKKANTNTLQIVDALTEGSYEQLRDGLPNVKIVQVIHVQNESAVNEAMRISKFVDAILLDSGNPQLEVKELGGTGRTHNWAISRIIREEVDVPIFLAGGLNADNVKTAINQVKPFGVDVCSGVRTEGKLDEKKLKAFLKAVKI